MKIGENEIGVKVILKGSQLKVTAPYRGFTYLTSYDLRASCCRVLTDSTFHSNLRVNYLLHKTLHYIPCNSGIKVWTIHFHRLLAVSHIKTPVPAEGPHIIQK